MQDKLTSNMFLKSSLPHFRDLANPIYTMELIVLCWPLKNDTQTNSFTLEDTTLFFLEWDYCSPLLDLIMMIDDASYLHFLVLWINECWYYILLGSACRKPQNWNLSFALKNTASLLGPKSSLVLCVSHYGICKLLSVYNCICYQLDPHYNCQGAFLPRTSQNERIIHLNNARKLRNKISFTQDGYFFNGIPVICKSLFE